MFIYGVGVPSEALPPLPPLLPRLTDFPVGLLIPTVELLLPPPELLEPPEVLLVAVLVPAGTNAADFALAILSFGVALAIEAVTVYWATN